MLIKLLKYEFRAAFRELITLYIALLGIASLLRPFYLYNLSGSLTGITVFVYAALIVAVMVMSCITIIQRFSKTSAGPGRLPDAYSAGIHNCTYFLQADHRHGDCGGRLPGGYHFHADHRSGFLFLPAAPLILGGVHSLPL